MEKIHVQTNIDVKAKTDSDDSDDDDDEDVRALKNSLDWITLDKGPNGLGFSILDSHDEQGRYIKIRGLVAGGVAEQQGQLQAHDKLVFVNEFHFDMNRFTLQDCVAMLKSLRPGKISYSHTHSCI